MRQPGETPGPLAPIAGEPSKWYGRFLSFCHHGGNLARAFEEEAGQGKAGKGRVPGAWSRAADQFQWRERFEEWRSSEAEKARAQLQTVLEKERRKRLSLLRKSRIALEVQLSFLNTVGLPTNWGDYWRGLRTVMELQREESEILKPEKAGDLASAKFVFNFGAVETKRI